MVDGTEWATGGKLVRVTTQRLGGGEPMVELFNVAIPTDDEAIELARSGSNSDSKTQIEIVRPLSENELKSLNLPRGRIQPA